ncbi:hypothetical protein AGMMS49982_21200 [Bacteroidia bacterium]|nr:hypothetical protein AGMMS49982_21200 [Bacteroidia bacterium]
MDFLYYNRENFTQISSFNKNKNKMKKIINRLLFVSCGIVKGFIDIANNYARDIENKFRFPKAIIDAGCGISEDSAIDKHARICRKSIINRKSRIGSYTYIGENALIQNATIGRYCSVARDVMIGLSKHPVESFSTNTVFSLTRNCFNIPHIIDRDLDFEYYLPIKIENDVWIGTRAIVMGGVTVGNGAVVAAGSVVTKDVPSYAIVGGVPAKIIRYRFPEEKITALSSTKWWEQSPKMLANQIDTLNNII